ncbi:MAG: hypothetical protein IPP72_17845 [Chitinophagaceae bacterium]|nr:hypothetical protein [Chitinophagaceae bacterium]
MQLIHIPFNIYLVSFVFFATLCSYNFHYIMAGAFQQQKISFSLIYSRYSAVFVLLIGITGVLFFFSGARILPGNVAIALLLTFLYSVPLFPFPLLAFTRKAGFIKTLLLAFTWMFVTAYIPLAEYGVQFTTMGLLIMAKRFLFMLMLCILFDNRDIAVDKIHGLSSLSTHLSAAQMKWLMYCIFILLFVMNFLLGRHAISTKQLVALQVAAFSTWSFIFIH